MVTTVSVLIRPCKTNVYYCYLLVNQSSEEGLLREEE